MAIEVKHGADPAALAAVGMGAGQGETRTKLRSNMLSATEQRVREDRAREFSAEQSQISRDFSSEQSQLGREHQLDMLQSRRQYPATENRFTAQQKVEFDRLNQTYEDARASGDFTPDELKELRRQIATKQAGIEPLPSLKDAPKNPWETAQSRLFTDPETGRHGYLDRDDVPQFFKDETSGSSSAPDPDKFFKRLESTRRQLTKMVQDGNGGMVEKPPTNEEAIAFIRQEDAAMKSYYEGAGAATPPPAGGASAKEGQRGSPPNPAARRRMEEIAKLGQDPDIPEGYTERKIANGKYIPKSLEVFITDQGVDADAVLEAARIKSEATGGEISAEEIVAAIQADLDELAKPPKPREPPKPKKTPYKPTNVLFF